MALDTCNPERRDDTQGMPERGRRGAPTHCSCDPPHNALDVAWRKQTRPDGRHPRDSHPCRLPIAAQTPVPANARHMHPNRPRTTRPAPS